MLVLVGGGVRCGKSMFALALARRLGSRRVFVATAEAGDEEMAARIARHVRERGEDFRTAEAPRDVARAMLAIEDAEVVVVDCLTLWITNLLLDGRSETEILEEVDLLLRVLRKKPFHAILVTNEVGLGVVPDSGLGRSFRDISGRAHQACAREADEIYFGALGAMIRLRPEPVSLAVPMELKR